VEDIGPDGTRAPHFFVEAAIVSREEAKLSVETVFPVKRITHSCPWQPTIQTFRRACPRSTSDPRTDLHHRNGVVKVEGGVWGPARVRSAKIQLLSLGAKRYRKQPAFGKDLPAEQPGQERPGIEPTSPPRLHRRQDPRRSRATMSRGACRRIQSPWALARAAEGSSRLRRGGPASGTGASVSPSTFSVTFSC